MSATLAPRKPASSRGRPEIFVWSGKYRVGIAKVDQQHKKLVSLINTLARQLIEEAPPSALAGVLDELASYASYHFKAEESLMRQYKVDADFQRGHHQAHASFIQEVNRAIAQAQKDPQLISTRTLTFLSRWLIQHILGTDMRMANEIIALEKGLTAEEARKRADSKIADSQDVLLGAMGELYESLALRTQELLVTNQRLKEELAFHRSAEEQLRTLSVAVEHSPVCTFITGADGVFGYVNRKFTEVTGYGVEQVRGQTPRLLKSGEMSDEAYADFWRQIAAGGSWTGEFRNRRRDGSLYWVRSSVTPILDDSGAVSHFLALQEDISERKETEAEAGRSQEQLMASLVVLERQGDDLARLNQAAELFQNCLSEEEACRACAYLAGELGLGRGGYLSVADAAGTLAPVAAWGEAGDLAPSFSGQDCWAIRRGQPHWVADADRGLVCHHYAGPPKVPCLCLPLRLRGRSLGLLHIDAGEACDAPQQARLKHVGAALGNLFCLTLEQLRRPPAA